MAKYQVLKRVETSRKMGDGALVPGEMVEFVQIPDEGPSQVQVYFVPSSKTDAEILGESARNHESEIAKRGIGFSGPQGPLDGAVSEPEPIMEVSVSKSGKITVKEAEAPAEEVPLEPVA